MGTRRQVDDGLRLTGGIYDVVVVGAGVGGTATARALSEFQLRVALLDRASDVGAGTSKANTAILHTGFDATTGPLESRLVRRGYGLLSDYARARGIAVEPSGAVLVAWDGEQVRAGLPIGRRAVVVGAEHVSFSAISTLAHGGCATAAMVTHLDAHQSYPALVWAMAGRRRIPVLTSTAVTEIVGRQKVERVVLSTGRSIDCDTVVFTGDWIPDHELARSTGLSIDAGTLGPSVGPTLQTSVPGIFAAGNLVHGAETADVCALEGRHAASEISRWLASPSPNSPIPSSAPRSAPSSASSVSRPGSSTTSLGPPFDVPVRYVGPLLWSSPNRIAPGRPPRDRLLLRTSAAIARIRVTQGEIELWTGRVRGAPAPNRSCWIPADWFHLVTGPTFPAELSANIGDNPTGNPQTRRQGGESGGEPVVLTATIR